MLDSGCIDTKRLLKRADLTSWLPQPDQFLRHLIANPVSRIFAVTPTELERDTRGRAPIAVARQVAMYLAHVTLGLDFTSVGRLYGRDRTTVAHACELIEERREDPDFDEALDLIESVVAATAVRATGLH